MYLNETTLKFKEIQSSKCLRYIDLFNIFQNSVAHFFSMASFSFGYTYVYGIYKSSKRCL